MSDALLTAKIPGAGYLKDIGMTIRLNTLQIEANTCQVPISSKVGSNNRLVAPISTVLFVDKDHQPGYQYPGILVPPESNLPPDKHFSDLATPGSVLLMQQPSHHSTALLGDIIATRCKIRGIQGVVVDGRARDIASCIALCEDGKFQCWAKGTTCAGISLEGKLYGVDVPLTIGSVTVNPGDILVADEGESAACVIPRDKLDKIMRLLPLQKEADDGLLHNVQNGMGIKEARKRYPNHYTNQ